MNAITRHPIFKNLMDHESDAHPVHIDDNALEKLMSQEDSQFTGTVSSVRIVEHGEEGIGQYKPAEGSLASRIFLLVEATHWCKMQSDFQDTVVAHPAFSLIRDELRDAYLNGTLNQKFDIIEATGAIVTFEKWRGLVSISLNESQMRAAIREHTRLIDTNNSRLIKQLNDPMTNVTWKAFKETSKHDVDVIEMSTSYSFSFAV